MNISLPAAYRSIMEQLYETMAAFAARLGVSVRTVKGWVAKGMPSIKCGRVRRVVVAEAECWLRDGCPVPTDATAHQGERPRARRTQRRTTG